VLADLPTSSLQPESNDVNRSSGTRSGAATLKDLSVTARYDKFDRPYFEAKVKSLCPECTVEYANAAGDPAKQAQQISSMVTKGVKVLVVDPQDSAAIKSFIRSAVDKGIKVIAYDRLAQSPVSAYVPFDTARVGELRGQALLAALGSRATKKAKVVMINGDDADPNAALFKKGPTRPSSDRLCRQFVAGRLRDAQPPRQAAMTPPWSRATTSRSEC
jgi:D-xylose transport system substrate-binding protein